MKARVTIVDASGRRQVRFLEDLTEVVVCTDRDRPVSLVTQDRAGTIYSAHQGERDFDKTIEALGISVEDYKLEVIDA